MIMRVVIKAYSHQLINDEIIRFFGSGVSAEGVILVGGLIRILKWMTRRCIGGSPSSRFYHIV
jgi:hypothetical protein